MMLNVDNRKYFLLKTEGGIKMTEKPLIIDLSENKNPEVFVEELRQRYPDDNVVLTLKGTNLEVVIDPKVPLQLRIDIQSFLINKAKESIYNSV